MRSVIDRRSRLSDFTRIVLDDDAFLAFQSVLPVSPDRQPVATGGHTKGESLSESQLAFPVKENGV